jgi:hypothetical protein
MDIRSARHFLEDNGYVVVRRAEPGFEENAFELNEDYVAFRLIDRQPTFVRPKELCDLIGIERHTLYRRLCHPDCPRVKSKRGPKGRLVSIQPTQELIDHLRRNKRSS